MNRQPWAEPEVDLLKSQYASTPTAALAKALDRPIWKVYSKAQRLGLAKSEEFLASPESGRLRKGQSRPGTEHTRFKRGQVPANKGLRRPGWAPGRMRETQFKKGNRTGIAVRNWKPVGTIAADPEGYLRIKVREAEHGKEATGFGNTKVWPLLNRHTWEQHYGPIPPGHTVVFKDGDRANCTIENLELVSRAELARRNQMWNSLPRELAEVIQLNGALKRHLRSKEEKGGQKHDC